MVSKPARPTTTPIGTPAAEAPFAPGVVLVFGELAIPVLVVVSVFVGVALLSPVEPPVAVGEAPLAVMEPGHWLRKAASKVPTQSATHLGGSGDPFPSHAHTTP